MGAMVVVGYREFDSSNHASVGAMAKKPLRSASDFSTADSRPNRKGSRVRDEHGKQSTVELKNQALWQFQASEAERTKTLAEFSYEEDKYYLLGIDPPTPEEVEETKSFIADLKRSCKPGEENEFDEQLTDLISHYDPFGSQGKRAIYFQVFANKGTSAVIFPAEDYEELKRKLNPQSGESFRIKGAKAYVRPDMDILGRLKAITE
jgi:hypothetical protein